MKVQALSEMIDKKDNDKNDSMHRLLSMGAPSIALSPFIDGTKKL